MAPTSTQLEPPGRPAPRARRQCPAARVGPARTIPALCQRPRSNPAIAADEYSQQRQPQPRSCAPPACTTGRLTSHIYSDTFRLLLSSVYTVIMHSTAHVASLVLSCSLWRRDSVLVAGAFRPALGVIQKLADGEWV